MRGLRASAVTRVMPARATGCDSARAVGNTREVEIESERVFAGESEPAARLMPCGWLFVIC